MSEEAQSLNDADFTKLQLTKYLQIRIQGQLDLINAESWKYLILMVSSVFELLYIRNSQAFVGWTRGLSLGMFAVAAALACWLYFSRSSGTAYYSLDDVLQYNVDKLAGAVTKLESARAKREQWFRIDAVIWAAGGFVLLIGAFFGGAARH